MNHGFCIANHDARDMLGANTQHKFLQNHESTAGARARTTKSQPRGKTEGVSNYCSAGQKSARGTFWGLGYQDSSGTPCCNLMSGCEKQKKIWMRCLFFAR
eukprot:5265051-Amphidinium_carterae.1